MTEHKKNSRTTREENEGGREFGHVHTPSQTQLASQNRGLADDSMQDDTRRAAPPGQRGSDMNRRARGAERNSPPGKAARGRTQQKRAA